MGRARSASPNWDRSRPLESERPEATTVVSSPPRPREHAGRGQRAVADHADRHWLGTLLLTGSAVAFSTAGFFTRLIHLDVWTMLFWRGIFAGLFIAVFFVWQARREALARIRAIGAPGLVIASLSTLAAICFINALRRSSVADVMVIGATAPFVTAALARLWIGEREDWSTLLASGAALVGVIVMVRGAVGEGHLVGDLLALCMTLCLAVMMVIIRKHRNTPMLPAACLSTFLSALVALPLAAPATVRPDEFVYLVLFGTSQFGLGLALLTIGTRFISATKSALIGALETPLGPIWVWLAFNEVPSPTTLVGGIIVMAAVSAYIFTSGRAR